MKNYIKGTITGIILASFSCGAVHAAEYIDDIELVKKDARWYVTYSGKEWITNAYPPEVSQDGNEFTEAAGSEDVKIALRDGSPYDKTYSYVWDGESYLAYSNSHDIGQKDNSIFRLSENLDEVLDKYETPNAINYFEIIDGKTYIATEKKWFASDMTTITSTDLELYVSEDMKEWTKLDDGGYNLCMFNVKNKLFVYSYPSVYLNSGDEKNNIIYETPSVVRLNGQRANPFYKAGDYLCASAQGENADDTLLAFSDDGIYWTYLTVNLADKPHTSIINISDVCGELVINSFVAGVPTYYTCSMETIRSRLSEKLPQNPVYVKLNGNYLGFEQPPVIEDGRTLVPMRFIFEQTGAEVQWNGEMRSVTATKDGMTVTLAIDDTNATVNGEAATLDVPARLINDKTMIPLRFLSENLGYTVDWSDSERTASIISGFPEIPLDGRQYYVIYREGYRDNRIELAVFDADGMLTMDDNILDADGYRNDIKYYLDGDKWVEFERGYERVSNKATEVIDGNIDVNYTEVTQ